MTESVLEYPYMRPDIEIAVEQLANADYQQKYWIRGEIEEGAWGDTFDEVFHTFFDDRPGLAEDPHSTIGEYLINKAEADTILLLVTSLDKLLNKYGPLMTPEQALADPEWSNVLTYAKLAHAEFVKSGFVWLDPTK